MTATPQGMVALSLPSDPSVLAAIGAIAIRHAQLDYSLKMTLKSVAGITPREARDATDRSGTRELCERVRKIAKQRIGESPALVKLDALLKRCRDAAEDRNRVMHGFSGDDPAGARVVLNSRHQLVPAPTAQELEIVVQEISVLISDLNNARIGGFLEIALSSGPKGGT